MVFHRIRLERIHGDSWTKNCTNPNTHCCVLHTPYLFNTCLAIDNEPCIEALITFEESTALFGQLIDDFSHNPDLLHADIAGMILILMLGHQSSEGTVALVIPGLGITAEEDVRPLGGFDHALHGDLESIFGARERESHE